MEVSPQIPTSTPPPPPPPSGEALALLSALANPTPSNTLSSSSNNNTHTEALAARDRALSSSHASYGDLCVNFGRILVLKDPSGVPPEQVEIWKERDPTSVAQLAHDRGSWSQLRQMAGLLLKNGLAKAPFLNSGGVVEEKDMGDGTGRTVLSGKERVRLPLECEEEIKGILLRCVVDVDGGVRRVASSTISTVSVGTSDEGPVAPPPPSSMSEPALSIHKWPELLPFLLHCIESGLESATAMSATMAATPPSSAASPSTPMLSEEIRSAVEGSLMTIRKALEDAPSKLEARTHGNTFDRIVPVLLRVMMMMSGGMEEGGEKWKKEALRGLNCLVGTMPGSMAANMDSYLHGLSSLASHESPEVRRLVCQAIVNLLSLRTEYLQPHMPSISEFMLKSTSDTDHNVALEACEFWLTFASLEDDACTPDMIETVRGLLPRLIPVFLRGMVYPADKIQELLANNEADESDAADRQQDVAPVFHSSRSKRVDSNSLADDTSHTSSNDDNNEDDDDDDDDNEWTLRKCSAASLDTLSGLYGSSSTLPPLLPALQEGLSHADPWVREASVLALGAIAEGCQQAMGPHMVQLHPYLMTQLTADDSLPQLRSIAAWTLGRYAGWAVEQATAAPPTPPGADGDIVGNMAEGLMGRALDANRRVQVACCSAFGVLVEATGDLMVPYLEPVYRILVQALAKYQTRSLMILFDTLGTMADFVGPAIGEDPLPNIYIPPLLAMWAQLAKQNPFDRTLLPLMESLASIALVIEINYQPWALETFDGAMSTIDNCLLLLSATDGDEYHDQEADPIVCAADLMDGLVEGLGSNFAALVHTSARYGDHFLQLLKTLTAHEVAGVRMSAFALLGDVARNAPTLIQTGTGELLTEAIHCVDPMYPSVCNNAVWALGEICVRVAQTGESEPLSPYAEGIEKSLTALLTGNAVDSEGNAVAIPGLAENAAAAMGRLAKVNPDFVANNLPNFLTGWCEGMAKISDPTERRDAFQGFVLAIHANPSSIQTAATNITDAVTAILFAVVSWHIPPDNMSPDLLQGTYAFQPFPSDHLELGTALRNLLHDLKNGLPDPTWGDVERHMPVNVRRLMRDTYQL